MRKTLILLSMFLIAVATPALAGKLFPPENAPSGTGACTNGEVLVWTGDSVECRTPTPGVNLTCPSGKVIASVVNGVPNCVVATPNASLSLSCPSGQVLTGISNGSPLCATMPSGSSGGSSLTITCPTGQVLKGISSGSAVCVIPSKIYGGTYQTLLSGVCRIGNPLTGSCTCAAGFTAYQTGEFMNPTCVSGFYGSSGQTTGCGYIQKSCYKN